MAGLSTGLACDDRRAKVTVRKRVWVWVGIDVGKASHHACALGVGDWRSSG